MNNSNTQKSIILDVYTDEELIDTLEYFKEKTGVEYIILSLESPLGELPEVKFTGTEEQIKEMLDYYTGGDEEQIEYLYDTYTI